MAEEKRLLRSGNSQKSSSGQEIFKFNSNVGAVNRKRIEENPSWQRSVSFFFHATFSLINSAPCCLKLFIFTRASHVQLTSKIKKRRWTTTALKRSRGKPPRG